MTRTARIALIFTTALAVFAVASPSTAQQGPARWDKPVLSVRVVDKQAWSGTDVAASLVQWGPAFAMVLTDDADADVTLEVGVRVDGGQSGDMVGATATRSVDGSTITHCRVGLAVESAGKDVGPILTHELGHCLGLGHSAGGEAGSVMHWFARDYQGGWSDTVTAVDVAKVKEMYR